MWDKNAKPTQAVLETVFELLISGRATREEVHDWAMAWYLNDNFHPERHIWDAVYSLTGADARTSDRAYLFGVEDFDIWLSELCSHGSRFEKEL